MQGFVSIAVSSKIRVLATIYTVIQALYLISSGNGQAADFLWIWTHLGHHSINL